MQKKPQKNITEKPARFDLAKYNYDDGIDPRELLPQKKGEEKPQGKKKLLHESWAEKIVEENRAAYYDEQKKEEKKKSETTPVDHDRNSSGKSPMIPVPKHLVATDELGVPKTSVKKKKFSFRKMVKGRTSGGSGKKV